MSSYLIFLKDWVELSLNIENGATVMWSVKSVGLRNLWVCHFRNFGKN